MSYQVTFSPQPRCSGENLERLFRYFGFHHLRSQNINEVVSLLENEGLFVNVEWPSWDKPELEFCYLGTIEEHQGLPHFIKVLEPWTDFFDEGSLTVTGEYGDKLEITRFRPTVEYEYIKR